MTFNKQQFIEEKKKEFFKEFGDIWEVDQLNKLWFFLEQSLNEAITKAVEEFTSENVGMGAITTTEEYADGWNDGRKEYRKRLNKKIDELLR